MTQKLHALSYPVVVMIGKRERVRKYVNKAKICSKAERIRAYAEQPRELFSLDYQTPDEPFGARYFMPLITQAGGRLR